MNSIKKHIVLAAMVAAAIFPLPGHGQDIVAGGIFYNIIDDSRVEVAAAIDHGFNRYEGSIILPERVYCDGVNYTVAAIAPRAFWQSRVTEVQIPNSVTRIGEAAFADAELLTNVTLPLGLSAVSRYMLAGTAVEAVALPPGVTTIGDGAFEDCASLRAVFLPSTLKHIGKRAFGYCGNLREIYCDSPTPPTAAGEAFDGCENVQVLLGDSGTARRFGDDITWGDGATFSLWVDEGIAVTPMMSQEPAGENWTALSLQGGLAYKIYGPDGYLVALTAATRYILPIQASRNDYTVMPTTLMRDEEGLQLLASTAPATIEETNDDSQTVNPLTILSLDGTIYIEGDTHGKWTFVYDVYGNLWYERPAVNNWISLPGNRVYIVRVGDTVRKIMLGS